MNRAAIDLAMTDLTLFGARVIENPWLTQDGTPYEVRRTWRERLFSRPWRPFRATRTVVPQVPDERVFWVGGAAVMHPTIAKRLREAQEQLKAL